MRIPIASLALLISSTFWMGCGGTTATTQGHQNNQVSADNSKLEESPATEEEAQAFAEAWHQAILASDIHEINTLVLWEDIAERAVANIDVSKDFRAGLVKGLTQSGTKLGQELGKIANEGSYMFVSAPMRDGTRHVIFRAVLPDAAGLNYHDFSLTKRRGKVRANRLYLAATGEDLADTLRAVMAPMVAANSSIVGRLTGKATEELNALKQLVEVKQLTAAGDKAGALQLLDSLPASTRDSKPAMLLRIMASDVADETEYLKVIDDYANKFPNDPSLGLVSMDAAVLRKDMNMMEDLLRQLKTWTGDETYLDLMVGGILAEYGQVEKAVAVTKNVDPATLGIPDGHEYKFTVALRAQDHPEAIKQLTILRDVYAYEFTNLESTEGFEELTQSAEFREWSNRGDR